MNKQTVGYFVCAKDKRRKKQKRAVAPVTIDAAAMVHAGADYTRYTRFLVRNT